jgi:hypothetical protein
MLICACYCVCGYLVHVCGDFDVRVCEVLAFSKTVARERDA